MPWLRKPKVPISPTRDFTTPSLRWLRFSEGLGLDYLTVWIVRMDAHSCLWEHCDYVELDGGNEKLRLHVPLITIPTAVLHFSGWRVHLTA
ncbi:hypothetical protein DSL72_003982 [Monilinia vaccinii-corymbosi]|uniref:Uncharacterized protein n=1 Tax=Monilinia vaccinii-corymbosi TaxID=61207 RepID=A0A8A3P6S1_9HELO|nr:hypothetical protein DSL72_003982 [Monilinia vaccinii-corymbosi]